MNDSFAVYAQQVAVGGKPARMMRMHVFGCEDAANAYANEMNRLNDDATYVVICCRP